nr:sodium channel protein Nach-like [Aedes albopictus]
MPRLNDTKICDASKIDCYRYSFVELYELAVRAGITGKKIKTCLCLPSCTSVDYQVGLSQVPINDFPLKLDFMRENADRGMMFIMLKERHYFQLWRREFVGPYQAIAQLGGLFTLLMGSSMLSFAEVVYYCCVRRLRRERPRHTMQPRVNRVRSRGHRIRLRVDPWAKRYHLRWGRLGT